MELSVMGYGRFGLSAGRRASGASGRGRTTAPKHATELAVRRAYDCCFEACSPPHIHLSAKYCEDMHSE